MLELILVVGILVISVLLSQVVRWCKNIYNLLSIQNNNIRILASGYRYLFEDIENKEKIEKYDQLAKEIMQENIPFKNELK
jgi:uncharacterized membrane protein